MKSILFFFCYHCYVVADGVMQYFHFNEQCHNNQTGNNMSSVKSIHLTIYIQIWWTELGGNVLIVKLLNKIPDVWLVIFWSTEFFESNKK